ncbi:MAG TPA: response regulator, partial [Candidatus Paceibacterota bacterium]|nr:response regulator [Candidatus Paceibacterota bacterium]
MKKTRIILGDDHLLLAEAIKNLLETEYEVVGIFSDPESLIEQAFSLEPDVAILDVHMPKKNG